LKDGVDFGSDELMGLVALIVQYMRTAATALGGYPKTIAPLMARTDFATIFQMMPEEIYFRREPDDFVELVRMAVSDYDMSQPLFTRGIYHNTPRRAEHRDVLAGLSRDTWLRDMTQGTERLTALNFNDDGTAQPHLESLGGYGDKTESVGHAGVQLDAPIFEIRSMGQLMSSQWYTQAMDVFLFLVSLNAGTPNPYKDTLAKENPRLIAGMSSADPTIKTAALAHLVDQVHDKVRALFG
jgi:hypothetical protein